MDKPTHWPRPGDAQSCAELLQRESVWHLSGYDGCLCAHFKVLGFEIDVGCHKSSVSKQGETVVSVACKYGFGEQVDCSPVQQEIERQIKEQEPQAVVVFRPA